MQRPPSHWRLLYLSVALTTMGTLLLELSLTRIFSVVFYYHFAFLAISIALFGLGAGGIFSYVLAGGRAPLFRKLGGLTTASSLFVLIALATLLGQKELSNTRLALVYLSSSLPFFFSGAVLSLAISETVARIDRVYFFDLIGAAGGCILLVPLLDHLGGPNTTTFVAVVFALAAFIWHSVAGAATARIASLALALLLAGFILCNGKYHLLDVRYAKEQRLENESFVQWNSFSRIAVAPEKGSGIPTIFIDADASTGIASFDLERLSEKDRHDLLYQGPGLPYAIRPGAKTLIIGPGGGWDVARALASGSKDITGVEINPIIATTIMRQKFADLSRRLYFRPEVRIMVEDGRSYVRRSREQYQVIQATLVDTWASTAAGAFALSENNLYTTNAFYEYLCHLSDDGLLAFTRWGFEPPRESLRLVSLAIETLAQIGEPQAWRHVIVGREGSRQELAGWGARDTVLISRRPFSRADIERARAALLEGHMEAVYVPGGESSNEFQRLLRSQDPHAYQRDYRFDISPVNDDRPFFFYTVQPRDIWNFLSGSKTSADYKINRAVPLLFGLVGVSIAATVIMLLLPPVVLRAKLPRQKGLNVFLLYFVAIGAGYILIEVALIQKFVLFLGHPTYALTVVIFSMLVSSGLGSYFSRRFINASGRRLPVVLAAVTALVGLLGVVISHLLSAGVGWPFWLKAAATVLLISPPAFLMGMPFPVGLRMLGERHKPSVKWAWSLNAAASVLGSAAAILCAIYLGLIETLLLGGALYLTALAAIRVARQPPIKIDLTLQPAQPDSASR